MMISTALKILDNQPKFQESMIALAESHCEKNVRPNEYGVVGDVLFWALKHVLGELFTFEVERAWIKIYSQMLKFIVPAAIRFERVHPTRSQRNMGSLRSELDIIMPKNSDKEHEDVST